MKFQELGDIDTLRSVTPLNTIRLGKTRYKVGDIVQAYDKATDTNLTIAITKIITNNPSSILRNHARYNHSVISNNISIANAPHWLRKRLTQRYHSHLVKRTVQATAIYFQIVDNKE